ncbi:MAG: tripartite tricarboxylate transporter substrate-binding protein [Pseudomonadota bacterium]
MKIPRATQFTGVFAALALVATAAVAEYPERPVTIVAPYGAGGSSDTLARIIAERLNEAVGGNFIVENRPGAGSRVGTESVARGDADGYTLLLADMPYAIVPNVHQDVAYAPDDFVAIAQVGLAPIVLFARPDLEDASIKTVVDMAAEPEAVAIGSGGIGATTHMVAELFQADSGTTLLHVPFGGTGPSLQGLAGSQVDVAFGSYASGRSLVEAGSIQVIGVTSPERAEILPDVPTFIESGVDLEVRHWWGLLAPEGTPDAIVSTLRSAVADVLKEDAVQERLSQLGVSPGELSAEEFQTFLSSESDRWAGIVESAGIQVQQ